MSRVRRIAQNNVGFTDPHSNSIIPAESKLFVELQESVIAIEKKLDEKKFEVAVPYDDTEIRKNINQLRLAVEFYIESLWQLGFRP